MLPEKIEPFRKRAPALEAMPQSGGNTFLRYVTAHAIASAQHRSPASVAAELWPSDQLTALVLARAASVPAMTSVAGWAQEWAQKRIDDSLMAMGPAAAGALLLLQSLVLPFDRAGMVSAPGFVVGAGNASFVAEGAPIPVHQLAAAAAQLVPYKLAAIGVLTREMLESSNAEAMISDVLMRSAAAALDVALFGSAAASAAAPAGLRNGVAALTASTSTDLYQAFYSDMKTLIDAVAPVGGNGPFVLIGSPGLIAQMIMRFVLQPGNVTTLASNAMGADLLCIAPSALVAAIDPEPVIETANAGTLHMNDTPLPIVNGGAPAAPQRSLFQTETIALKMRWPISWAMRDPRAIAWLTPGWH